MMLDPNHVRNFCGLPSVRRADLMDKSSSNPCETSARDIPHLRGTGAHLALATECHGRKAIGIEQNAYALIIGSKTGTSKLDYCRLPRNWTWCWQGMRVKGPPANTIWKSLNGIS